ncbi:hypothetical protein A2291_06950 [candidate division WOR-1 bacterium RIFOXYB2_FULL_42_35]|uniref:Uncharacterized protein n=1 Tax=candidate division WOR-1 bacterium RIFOXYC2_FULL_41_25 TaxID=1802586 RepID=A0A1F4TPL5_UNCSA|nr:MAG: hypothetical protein A2291_06950 [candidate division WOR-1 bacterium RIFOXYB2_FULL_42_35]OGC24616.1 MAG: hypothetical protein A2247_06730 [candidate division WOR-1 bacterium RIFOXYA2_FULL_41_14]OGC34662.1 MAG: hypothetical protein A2462_04965 [candidate division WOR-1 bacterium RIFOXYC2_FULL_41_25]OGC41611.1 MAG: hypothetical protein A2548_01285 [candidate division WOR-1 bacterium RIFOXYD2_FULL_41_8]
MVENIQGQGPLVSNSSANKKTSYLPLIDDGENISLDLSECNSGNVNQMARKAYATLRDAYEMGAFKPQRDGFVSEEFDRGTPIAKRTKFPTFAAFVPLFANGLKHKGADGKVKLADILGPYTNQGLQALTVNRPTAKVIVAVNEKAKKSFDSFTEKVGKGLSGSYAETYASTKADVLKTVAQNVGDKSYLRYLKQGLERTAQQLSSAQAVSEQKAADKAQQKVAQYKALASSLTAEKDPLAQLVGKAIATKVSDFEGILDLDRTGGIADLVNGDNDIVALAEVGKQLTGTKGLSNLLAKIRARGMSALATRIEKEIRALAGTNTGEATNKVAQIKKYVGQVVAFAKVAAPTDDSKALDGMISNPALADLYIELKDGNVSSNFKVRLAQAKGNDGSDHSKVATPPSK